MAKPTRSNDEPQEETAAPPTEPPSPPIIAVSDEGEEDHFKRLQDRRVMIVNALVDDLSPEARSELIAEKERIDAELRAAKERIMDRARTSRVTPEEEAAFLYSLASTPTQFGVTQCGVCGTFAASFHREHGPWYDCLRCGTIQRDPAAIRADYEPRVAALESGDTITIDPPFRSMRDRDTMATAPIEGEYILERGGAIILMQSLGLRYLYDDTSSLTFIKE